MAASNPPKPSAPNPSAPSSSETTKAPSQRPTDLETTLLNLQSDRTALINSYLTLSSHSSTHVRLNDSKDQSQRETAVMQEARSTIKERIKLLGQYNEIKDVALGLVGMIADQRGVRIVDVLRDLGVDGDGDGESQSARAGQDGDG